ncbi:hypothetical protein [Murimonas intestini]|uniref:Transcriptional regulator n=1 Tax=Murimonas intestini TaxID=1337051 RepID=A0AB73T805_9FIRM|nr:hypothetical protein [Murimonas intestini]MCR1839803.1 hypothetical protein [Murimonas intestini]MCR1866645.1 hypothetical protein [Murimonas intestini]MCR1883478.1 hypothetical protein [Murimonas intestini]
MDCLHCEKKEKFAGQFKSCGDMLSAIGDETRQSIILTLIEKTGRKIITIWMEGVSE